MISSRKLDEKRKEVAIAFVSSKYAPIIESKNKAIKSYKDELSSLSSQLSTVVSLKSSEEVLSDPNLSSIANLEESQIKDKIDYTTDMISESEESIDYIKKAQENEVRIALIELEKSHDESNIIPKRMKEATDKNFTREDAKYLLIVLLQIILLAAFIYIIVKLVK